ncbi:hypothetical protein BH10ACT1_BH10ACT1_26420 [soil metagenome]
MRARGALAAVALAVALAVGACSGSDPSPAEARRDRIEQRLRTFSEAQSTCILGRLEARTLLALDKTTGLQGDDRAQADYSDAVVTCVTDPEAGATTTSAPTTTAAG